MMFVLLATNVNVPFRARAKQHHVLGLVPSGRNRSDPAGGHSSIIGLLSASVASATSSSRAAAAGATQVQRGGEDGAVMARQGGAVRVAGPVPTIPALIRLPAPRPHRAAHRL